MAIDARIHLAAVAILGVLEHFQMNRADIYHPQRYPQLFGCLLRTFRSEERSLKGNARHLDILIQEHPDCQHTIQASGHETKGTNFRGFVHTHLYNRTFSQFLPLFSVRPGTRLKALLCHNAPLPAARLSRA